MTGNLRIIGASLCILAFLLEPVLVALPVAASGPRSPGPDIYVVSSDIKFLVDGTPATSAIQGAQVTVNVTVRNAGDSNSTSVNVSFYDGVVFLGSFPIPWNVTNTSVLGYAYCETVWDTTGLIVGNHSIKATVQDFIADDNLNNNTAAANFTVLPIPKSHVYVSSIALNYDALIGDRVTVTATVRNNGTKEQSDKDSVKFYVGTTPLANGIIDYPTLPPLPNDNTTTATAVYYWDTSTMQEGPFFVMAEVVSSRVRTESHIINLTSPLPNVYISSVNLDRDAILLGETAHITVKLKNNGTKNATDEEVWMLVDNATSPTPNHTALKTVPKGDGDATLFFDWNSTDSLPGTHTFKVRVPGSSDKNAVKTSSQLLVQPRLPNVALTSFVATPSVVDSGGTITLSAMLENTGTADAYNQEVKFFLNSTDAFPLAVKKMNVRAGTAVFVNTTHVPDIGENNVDMNFFATYNTTKLNDSVLVRSTIKPRPDLVVTSVDVPRLMTVGESCEITSVVTNKGRAPAFNFAVKFNLGTELPYIAKNLDLNPGQTLTVNWSFLPSMPGTNLRLKVEVDAMANVSESDEFNNINESIKDITVRAQPRASIELNSAVPSKKSITVEKGLTGTVKVAVELQNTGEKEGTVQITVTEGRIQFVLDNVTVPANSTKTVDYKWNLSGARTHTAKVVISGPDTGLKTSRILSTELAEKTPGFEALLMVAAIGAAFILARRRK